MHITSYNNDIIFNNILNMYLLRFVFCISILANLNVTFDVSKPYTDALLKLLTDNGHPELSITCRSLLKTKRRNQISFKFNVEYYYLGIEKMLKVLETKYSSSQLEIISTFKFVMNIYGLPLFRSKSISILHIHYL